MISVLIVDDHYIARSGITNILASANDIKVIGEAELGEEAIKLAHTLNPDIILMDIQMPKMNGIEATQKILRDNPNIKIIGLTACEADQFPKSLILAGALGYLTKNTSQNELLTAIRNVYAGHMYVTPNIAYNLSFNQLKGKNKSVFEKLSNRELAVMYHLIKGASIQDIADDLKVSDKSIRTYKSRLLNKLNLKNDIELTHFAIKHGMVSE